MLRPIIRLVALSTLSFGAAGSLLALPAGSSLVKPITIVAQAVLAPADDSGMWKLSAFGAPGTSAMASWIVDGDIQVIMTATVGPEGGVSFVRFAPPSGAVIDLTLDAPGYSRKVISDVGAEGATLTIGVAIKHRHAAGHD